MGEFWKRKVEYGWYGMTHGHKRRKGECCEREKKTQIGDEVRIEGREGSEIPEMNEVSLIAEITLKERREHIGKSMNGRIGKRNIRMKKEKEKINQG